MIEDAELLRQYADEKSQGAFTELVKRRINLVYSVALRQVAGDTQLAEDVTQRVFADLARKAVSLSHHTVLSGWLCRSAQFAASDIVRAERRRRARELQAQLMHETSIGSANGSEAEWDRLRPLLDQLLSEMNERDRDALALRYFETRSFSEIGRVLRLTDEAARKRVDRAIERLGRLLRRRGITSTSAALGLALANHVGIAAPVGLTIAVTGVALTVPVVTGTVLLPLIIMSKINTIVISGVLLAGAVVGGVEVYANRSLRADLTSLKVAKTEFTELDATRHQLDTELTHTNASGAHPQLAELATLRQRVSILQARPGWVDENKMKSVAVATNAGWSTAEAALETFFWANSGGDRSVPIENFKWVGDAKGEADAAFQRLSAGVRAKYGSADRLAGTVLFGSVNPLGIGDYRTREGPSYSGQSMPNDPVVAIQSLVDPEAPLARPGVVMDVPSWVQLASGQERAMITDLCATGGSFTVGTSHFSEEAWQRMVARLNPVTGEVLPSATQH